MLAKAVDQLPSVKALAGGCQYEPKWDGYRGLIGLGSGAGATARIRSRRGTDLTTSFPEIAGPASEQLPPGTLLDGELVVWHDKQLDFSQLQRRLSAPGRARGLARELPASYVAFDVLMLAGRDLTVEPLRTRRRALEQLLPSLTPPLQITPATRDHDVATTWLADYAAAGVGIEGLVIKGLGQPYRPGRRDWQKLRSRHSVEVVAGAITGTLARPERVILGLPTSDGSLTIAGSTGPLRPGQQQELARLLTAASAGHPWPAKIPMGRLGVWTGDKSHLDVVLVEPTLVVEVEADNAYEHRKWRHLTRYLRARPDLDVADLAPEGDASSP